MSFMLNSFSSNKTNQTRRNLSFFSKSYLSSIYTCFLIYAGIYTFFFSLLTHRSLSTILDICIYFIYRVCIPSCLICSEGIYTQSIEHIVVLSQFNKKKYILYSRGAILVDRWSRTMFWVEFCTIDFEALVEDKTFYK